jgi:hypothetical protein
VIRVAIVAAALAVAFGGCAPTSAYVTARRVESGASDSLRLAYVAWREVDVNHQNELLINAQTYPDYEAAVAKWRSGPQKDIDNAFATARDALVTLDAALGVRDAVSRTDFSLLESKVVAAIGAVVAVLTRYGVKIPVALTPPQLSDAAGHAYDECDRECPAIVWPDHIPEVLA